MQAIMETSFDCVYLLTVTVLGIWMIAKNGGSREHLLFGIMAVTLGVGDAFHLVPRAVALCTTGLEQYTVALGVGKFITSITMTVFYILLYYVWRLRYRVRGQNGLTGTVLVLAGLRILLCLFPQNGWTSPNPPLSWGIWRNLPFLALGVLIILLFWSSAREARDRSFRWMWLTIVLSFGFYLPVVLLADRYPMVGMLMIPKTCAYVWTVLIGFWDLRRSRPKFGKYRVA